MHRSCALAGIILLAVGAGTAGAQERGRVGLVLGYPASIGAIYAVSPRVAVRPEASLSWTAGESTSPGTTVASTSRSWSVGVGVSALVYLGGWDGLRTYLSPRFSFTRNRSASEPVPGLSRSENRSTTYAAAGSWGAQYSLGRRFSVFGEVGLSYARQTSSYTSSLPNVLGTDSTANTVSTRSAIGAIVSF
jgi:hypothetical protein